MGKVTRKGQVTIPKPIRDELGIKPGDEVEFREENGKIVIQKDADENPFEKWRGIVDTDETVEERMAILRGRDEKRD